MNAQERDQLQQFLATLRQQRVQAKDPVADGLIRDALASQADATYLLVQRVMAMGLALEATQNRLKQLQASSAAALQASNPDANAAPAQTPAPMPNGGAPTAQPSLWMRGLVGQVGGTALGVAAGVVAGGAVLQGLQALWGDDAASPNLAQGPAGGLSAAEPDAGDGLWDLGDDWT
ncbi:DUF2076 family protein [Limnohabitans sp. Rim28]|uniref:DUF2076 family protein n=1 Tax=Limnohabitans sp. Rim28 TaxID=1100720 RepID=UPI00030DFEDD|nr:DUF2076 family protein [Limnohabitans sp. Rim28]PVE06942.1 hypothetical protein B472_09365 [Limnohabitans sp. Rim28]